MENKAHALLAGAFLIAFSAALVAVALWMAQRGTSHANYDIVTTYAVSGLNEQAPVKYRGVPIGHVADIDFDPQNPLLIRIRIEVEKDAPVTNNTYAKLSYQGVTGLAYIELADNGKPGTPLLARNGRTPTIPMHPSLLAEVGNSGQQLLNRVNELAGKLNRLADQRNQAHITQILANMDAVTQNLARMEKQLSPALQNLPALTGTARQTLASTNLLLKNLNHLTLATEARLQTVDKLGNSVAAFGQAGQQVTQQLSGSTLPELQSLIQSLSRASQDFDHLVSQLQQRPQSLLFGRAPAPAGPGEPGFRPPLPEGNP